MDFLFTGLPAMTQLCRNRFARWLVPLCLVLLFGGVTEAQTKPQRVVSLNLCTDELLLTLADREQISSLSFLIRDPSISIMVEEAEGLPLNDGRAESILFEGGDLVLMGTFGQHNQAALLKAQGLNVMALGPWTSLADGREQIRALAQALGHPERGEALIAEIDATLQRTKDIAAGKPTILVYDRGGWVSAANSPLNEFLNHMGFRPHHEALGLPYGGVARLESIVVAPPDYLLVDEDAGIAVDNGTALFSHPALVSAVPLEQRLVVPGKLTICGGPSTPAAIEALAEEVRAKVR